MTYHTQKLQTSFQDYCFSKGIELLREDIKFIKERINDMPLNARKDVLRRYHEEWLKGMASAKIVYQRQNLGRRMANTYIRDLKL